MESLSALHPFVRVAHYYQFPIEQNPRHFNRIGYCYAFHLVDVGKGKVTVSGRTYPVKKGDLIYFPPGVLHTMYSEPNQLLATYNLYCELWTNQPQAVKHHLAIQAADYNSNLLTKVLPCQKLDELPVVIPLIYHASLMSLITQIVEQARKKELYTTWIMSSLLEAFLLQLMQMIHTNHPIDYRVLSIIERIDKHANTSHHYDDWLAECGLKKTHFHTLFKQATGMSPKAYWSKAIMKQAKVALLESHRSITDIAEDLGYSSIHHFTKQFTRHHGISPSEFRKSSPAFP